MKNINSKEINKKIFVSLKNTFSKSKIPKNINELKIGDLKEWDSLGNYNLLLEIEKNFKIRFKSTDLTKITSINQIISYIKIK
jgi:acyl carrier protein